MSSNKNGSFIQDESGFDYESAYSAAENATIDPKKARESRAAVIEEQLEENESPRQTRERLRAAKERKKRRKTIITIAVLAVAAACIAAAAVMYISYREKLAAAKAAEKTVLEISTWKTHVQEIYTYGTHLNISGSLPKEAVNAAGAVQTELVLYTEDEEFIQIPIVISGDRFTISEKYNGGLYLDGLDKGTYKMFIRVTVEELPTETTSETAAPESEPETEEETTEESDNIGIEKKKPEETIEEETSSEEAPRDRRIRTTYLYFALENDTGYQETVYYTMSSVGNKAVIGNESEYPTMQITVAENTDSGIYDVVLDAGHGGSDEGAPGIEGHHEKDFLLPLALKIRDNLEKEGLKVALTRDNDSETLTAYGDDGRIARACQSQAKYMISLHMNDEGYGMSGLMIYAYPDIDYAFARLLNSNIQEATGIRNAISPSAIGDNIFTKMLTQADIDQAKADDRAAGLKPYEPTLRSAYNFMIRECGGIVTGAFKDDRNPSEKYNPYCYDNTCIEGYLAQLGYITDSEDINIMITKMDDYARAISDSLLAVYKGEVTED